MRIDQIERVHREPELVMASDDAISLELSPMRWAIVVVADIQEQPKRGRYYETDTTTTTLQLRSRHTRTVGLFVQLDIP